TPVESCGWRDLRPMVAPTTPGSNYSSAPAVRYVHDSVNPPTNGTSSGTPRWTTHGNGKTPRHRRPNSTRTAYLDVGTGARRDQSVGTTRVSVAVVVSTNDAVAHLGPGHRPMWSDWREGEARSGDG